jgi:hypothetical protein
MASIAEKIDRMIATVRNFPLAKVIAGPKKRAGLAPKKLDELERTHNVMLGPALREFYGATNGLKFFWRVPEDTPQDLIERYNAAVESPSTAINWEMAHGIMIPTLENLLTEKPFGDLFLTSRDEEATRLWAGRTITDDVAVRSVRVFDRYLAEGNEDGAIGLLMFPDAEPRIVGITDSGMVDPGRPWMKVEVYLDLILAMGGEHGSRYEHTGIGRIPPGELVFTPDQIEQFGRDIFRRLDP